MRLRSHTQGFTLEAIAGIDIALWDIRGKYYNEPIWAVARWSLPLANSRVFIGGRRGRLLNLVARGIERVLDEGFSVVKTSCGRGAIDEQMDLVREMSRAVGEPRQVAR